MNWSILIGLMLVLVVFIAIEFVLAPVLDDDTPSLKERLRGEQPDETER